MDKIKNFLIETLKSKNEYPKKNDVIIDPIEVFTTFCDNIIKYINEKEYFDEKRFIKMSNTKYIYKCHIDLSYIIENCYIGYITNEKISENIKFIGNYLQDKGLNLYYDRTQCGFPMTIIQDYINYSIHKPYLRLLIKIDLEEE